MKPAVLFLLVLGSWRTFSAVPSEYLPPTTNPTPGDKSLTDYFRHETETLSEHCLADIHSAEDWNARREEYRRQLQEMLGLWPWPPRTDIKPVITDRLETNQFAVEKLYFQASPGLYCTANLYLPKPLDHPAPTILYLCGHLRQMKNGVSLGNKVSYQEDGAWFARNGYVCLVLDSLLMGEIQGLHTGTRDLGMWWWNSRGYTPAGVEAWFGIRALDYLCTRPEVDTNRLGVTGHSGGGAYSWTVTALDDRVKAAAPLAGLADLRSHILEGVLDHHCDCNFFVNIYRWDFPQVAALAAPRPLLIGGTDQDPLFHLSSTLRIYHQVQRIYRLCGAADKLGLAIAPGPHDEVPELRLAVLRWFNRFLKGKESPVAMAAVKFFTGEQLKVFDQLPTNAINAHIQDVFVPKARPQPLTLDKLRRSLRQKVFSGWPETASLPRLNPVFSDIYEGVQFSAWDFDSEHDVPLRLYLLRSEAGDAAENVRLNVLNQTEWANWVGRLLSGFKKDLQSELASLPSSPINPEAFARLKRELSNDRVCLAFVAPRGVGLNAWSGGPKRLTKIRRRLMLLGQTLDGMRVWDIRQTLKVLRSSSVTSPALIEIHAEGDMAVNALYAALFEPDIRALELANLPESQESGPDYLGVLKVTDIPAVLDLVRAQAQVKLFQRDSQ